MKKIITLLLVFVFTFSMMSFDLYAASKPAKVKKLTASAAGYNAANLSWSKASGAKGYTVFRNGAAVVNTKAKSFTDSGLSDGTSYSYTVKAYKTKKQYYNSKKHKWVDKKPKKSQWVGKQTRTKYIYGKSSPTRGITTASIPAYTITWKNYNGSVLQTRSVKRGTVPAYTGPTPTRPNDTSYAYKFSGWSPAVVSATGNAVYTAQYTQLVTVTWKNYDGKVLKRDTVAKGTKPNYSGPTPTKPTDTYAYTFSGWTPQVGVINSNTTYTATFTQKTPASYTITWKNYDQSVLKTETVKEGVTPSYTGTPTRPDDNNYVYTFNGWSPAVGPVTKNITYTAQYTATPVTVDTNKLTEDETIYFDFNGVRIHYGQAWTNELNNQLKNASQDKTVWSFVRKGNVTSIHNQSVSLDQKIYLYNTTSYAPFLAVYVVNNQIIEFADNAQTLGSYQGTTFTRGMDDLDFAGVDQAPRNSNGRNNGGVLVAAFSGSHNDNVLNKTPTSGYSNESTLSYHFMNAARVANGLSVMKRSSFLEGVNLQTGENLTWTCDITNADVPWQSSDWSVHLENVRYGAQAFAETMAASNICTHVRSKCTKGPCAYGYDNTVQYYASYAATGKDMSALGEICCGSGRGGEGALFIYGTSNEGHWQNLMSSDWVSVGVGWCTYQCTQFSNIECQ